MLRLFKNEEVTSILEYLLINPVTRDAVEVNILYITKKRLFRKEEDKTQVNIRQIKLKNNSSELLSDIVVIDADIYQIKSLIENEDFGCKLLNDERNVIMNKIRYGYNF